MWLFHQRPVGKKIWFSPPPEASIGRMIKPLGMRRVQTSSSKPPMLDYTCDEHVVNTVTLTKNEKNGRRDSWSVASFATSPIFWIYRSSVNEVGTPPIMVGGVHLQVRLWLLKNSKRKYGVDPPTMMGGANFIYWPPVTIKTFNWHSQKNLTQYKSFLPTFLLYIFTLQKQTFITIQVSQQKKKKQFKFFDQKDSLFHS